MIEELVSRAFAARDAAHIQHLKTKSYAEHIALDGFYNSVISAIDTLGENYIGLFGDIGEIPPAGKIDTTDIKGSLQDEADWIISNRQEISNGDDSLGALVDDLVEVYTHTIYRLGLG